MLETGADVGLAFDGDADRVFLVDEKAQPVIEAPPPPWWRRPCSTTNPGSTVIYNLICSKSVPEVISENGGRRYVPGWGTRSSRE